MAVEGLDPELAAERACVADRHRSGGMKMVESISIGALDSPLGVLRAACSERGVCRVIFPQEAEKPPLERWIGEHMPGADRIPTGTLLGQALAELAEYFDGTRLCFTLPLDLRGNTF